MTTTLCVYVIKDVRVRGYFSKPKGFREQRSLGNTDLSTSTCTAQRSLASTNDQQVDMSPVLSAQ